MSNSATISPMLDLLTVEQFAERLQVSRTTVFGWLKIGALKEGVHFFRLGRVLRFRWHEGLFFNSPAPSQLAAAASAPSPSREAPPPHKASCRKRQPKARNQPAVNLDY